ncbi:MAG: hypothetical protein ACE5DK_02415 [Paracoccaceae bacterium]
MVAEAMPYMTRILGLALVAATLAGCARAPLPPPPEIQVSDRAAQWPRFLPLDAILASDLEGQEQAARDARAVNTRAWRLRRRARLLSQPINDAYDAIAAP